MQDGKKIREEVYLSIVEQLKAEIFELDKEMERLEREKVKIMILKELNSDINEKEGKSHGHSAHAEVAIEELEKKQTRLKKDIDEKQLKLTKLAKIKTKIVK